MSDFLKGELQTSKHRYRNRFKSRDVPKEELDAFCEGQKEGFRIAVQGFGVWKNGGQVIGCQDHAVNQVLSEMGIER